MDTDSRPERVNRRGCIVIAALLALALLLFGVLGSRTGDDQLANEVASEGAASNEVR